MPDGGPGQSRTADLRFRKPLLYPSELRGHKDLAIYCPLLSLVGGQFAVKSKGSPARIGGNGFDVVFHCDFHAMSEMMRYHLGIAVNVTGHCSLSTAPSRVITLPF